MNVASPPLAAQAFNAIFHNPHLNHRKMHVSASKGRVILEGCVESYFEKQIAQEALRKIEGVAAIDNRLTVSWS